MGLPRLSFACPDWEDKLRAGKTPIPDLPFDPVYADVAVDLLDKLRIPDVPGTPTVGEAGGEWVRDIVRAAFGCVTPVTDAQGRVRLHRQVREVFNLVPKKNTKTFNAGAMGIVWLLLNRTPNVNGVIVGPTQAIADTCFQSMAQMIRLDPYLERRFQIIEHRKIIRDISPDGSTGRPRNARLRVATFDPKVVTGGIIAFAILDELHLMSDAAYASRVLGQIRGGMVTNPESLLIIITTQSERPPAGVFETELTYARKVRDGEITENVSMLPVLYEFPEAMQADKKEPWRDPALWYMVTPNLGRSVHLERMTQDFGAACDKGRQNEIEWASQHLNIQVGMAYRADSWPGAKWWNACALPGGLSLADLLEQSECVTVGGDWGGADDLAALAVIGRLPDRSLLAWGRAWARPTVLEERKAIAEMLRTFERDGDLSIVDTIPVQVTEMADVIEACVLSGKLPEAEGIGFDTAGIDMLMGELALRGITQPLVCGVPQNWSLQPATQGAALMLESRLMRHGGQPLLGWAVGNAKQEMRSNTYMVTKAASGASKIDPLAALFDAFWLMRKNPVAAGASAGSYVDAADLVIL